MAKGLEDTAFYVFNRLTSLNEVGGDPGRFGLAPAAVHQALTVRQQHWPHALSPTSTHDTKRSEDVRARISVLSEMPEAWRECLTRWSEMNEVHRLQVEDDKAPDRNVEYQLYQTLLGAWPVEPCPDEEYTDFIGRIQAYMEKATHEAKVHTSWINPNADYDAALRQFVGRILDPDVSPAFLSRFSRVSAAHRPLWFLQRAVAVSAQDHHARRAGHVSGHRVVGLQFGRSGQSPARRLREAPPDAGRIARTCRRSEAARRSSR